MNDLAALPNTFPRQDQTVMKEIARVLTDYLMPQYLRQPLVQDVQPGTVGKVPQNQIDPMGAGVGAAMDLASMPTPVGIAKAVALPAIGLAARRALPPLAMDEASRMARAKAMGFYTEMPLYHGTASEFRTFDLSKGGNTSGAGPARQGVWAARNPDVADEFAQTAADKGSGNQQVMPLLHRSEKPAMVRLSGEESNQDVAATLAQAWDDGYTSILFKNYTTPGGKTPQDIVVVKDPSQLRSPFAVFDPAKKSSGDLLAGLAGTGGILGAGTLVTSRDGHI